MKWFIIILIILIGVLFVLYLIGKKSVHTEITINAPSEAVWSVLTDVQNIKEWNSVLIPVEGELVEGNQIKYEFYQEPGNKSVMSAKVKEIINQELINQKGGISGVLTFDHMYVLEPAESGVKVIIHEEYRGIMVPFWNPEPVENAYSRLLNELKIRAETVN